MQQVTITVTADAATIRRVLGVLEEDGRSGDAVDDSALRHFVESLSEQCYEVVRAVVVFNRQGQPASRSAIVRSSTFSDSQFNGLHGTIVRRWREFCGNTNPFAGWRIAPHADDWFYVLQPDPAERLQEELEAAANRWRAHSKASTPASLVGDGHSPGT